MSDLDNTPVDNTDNKTEPTDQQTPQYTPEEHRAIAEGWKPKDQWEGDESEWKPAKAFLEFGELKNKLQESEKEKKKLNKVVELMKNHHLQVRQSAYEDALKTLRAERQAALKDENFARAEELRDRIDDLRDRQATDRALPADVQKNVDEQAHEPDPEFFKFLDRNPWYKPNGRDEMSKKADALGFAYAQANPDWGFKDVIEQVEKDIKRLYPEKFSTPRSPVNEPGAKGGGGGKAKESVSLSAEEKAVAAQFGMTEEQYAKELKTYKGR